MKIMRKSKKKNVFNLVGPLKEEILRPLNEEILGPLKVEKNSTFLFEI